jgi:crotonobetainyl-CoA:carnitine CoA-transferase CaiB-like acyl-CoA transferase
LVNDLATLCADPHVQARGSVVTVDEEAMGPVLMPAPAPRLTRTPAGIAWAGRPPGADTDEVCRQWLGIDAAEIGRLRSSGAIA